MRAAAMLMPREQMEVALAEYSDRREAFRDWLLRQLVMGVHFGVPPGCEPKGEVNPKQWKHKPSLYKAGADFICDLMAARDEYEPDMQSWELSGKTPGLYPFICRLYSRGGELLGEGRGAAIRGLKKRDDNAAIKCGKKCAKVDATINAWGLSDLFMQDVEDMTPQRPSRGKKGVTAEDLKNLWHFWQSRGGERREDFIAMLHKTVSIEDGKENDPKCWNADMLEAVYARLDPEGSDTASL